MSLHPYDLAWLVMLKPGTGPGSLPDAPSFETLLAHFEASAPQVVYLSDATGLADCDAALGLHAEWIRETIPASGDLKFQEEALREGALRGRCPLTGQEIRSVDSFVATRQVIFYRFQTREVFFLATAHIGSGFARNALYFPERELLITRDRDEWGTQPRHVAILKARWVRHAERVRRYLGRPAGGDRRAILLGHPNFAHHLQNELPAVEALRRARLLGTVDRFLVLREPLGPLDRLFPEIDPRRIHRFGGSGASKEPIADDLFLQALDLPAFVVNIGSRRIPESVVRRVRREARRQVPLERQRAIARARRAHVPLVWISIRLHNRTWSDQHDGLVHLMREMARTRPKAAVVLDGFSVSADLGSRPGLELAPHERDLLQRQREWIGSLCEALGIDGPVLFNTVGCSILESVLWAEGVDCYLTHHGTLQHKVGWFGNKPGVVHSNPHVLASDNVWVSAVREGGVAPVYIEAKHSREAGGVNGRDYSRNYEIDWQVLYKALQTLLIKCRVGWW